MSGSHEAFLGSKIKKMPQTFAVCGFFINFAAKLEQIRIYRNGKQDFQAYDGDVGAALC